MPNAKIVDGSVVTYPYFMNQLRKDAKNVSFHKDSLIEGNTGNYEGFSVVEVTESPRPETDIVSESAPVLIDGEWTQQWSGRDYTKEESDQIRMSVINKRLHELDAVLPRSVEDIVSVIGTDSLPEVMIARLNEKNKLREELRTIVSELS